MVETSWDASEGEVGIRGLRRVHLKWITFWESLTQKVIAGEEPIRGIAPQCAGAWMYLFKNYALKNWMGFAEVYRMPLRVGKYEPEASKADRGALIQTVRSLGSDASGVISKSTEIEFIEAQKGSSLK